MNNETTNAISSYDALTLVTEMTIVNDAVDLLIGSPTVTSAMTELATPLMRRYNELRDELIRRSELTN